MEKTPKQLKEDEIEKEVKRLNRIYTKINKKKKAAVVGLIQRAAFMRVSLAELEEDINENGLTEQFCQGDQEPYERERPTAKLYNSLNTSYQKITKQLTDLLPKEEPETKVDDGFENFVGGRDD